MKRRRERVLEQYANNNKIQYGGGVTEWIVDHKKEIATGILLGGLGALTAYSVGSPANTQSPSRDPYYEIDTTLATFEPIMGVPRFPNEVNMILGYRH